MLKQRYKTSGNKSLFDVQFAVEKLAEIGNPLDRIDKVIDFEVFRVLLEDNLLNTNKKSNAGAKPYDVVLMFKILILQRYYGLGDKQVEYQILDRTSFKNFLGFETGDKIPDEKTVWAFREQLTKSGLIELIFNEFNSFLQEKELILNQGQMIDASFTVVPRQHNTREENLKIKNGGGEELWNDNPHKKRHKDIDARWTKKNNETFYGYKNHAKVDTKSKFISTFVVTSASVHDSQPTDNLLNENDLGQDLHGDSAYTGKNQEETIAKYKMVNQVHQTSSRNNPLNEDQKKSNTQKSKIRARVEHVFGFMEQSMNGLKLKSIGIVRATGIIGLINLTYNLFRYEQITRLKIIY